MRIAEARVFGVHELDRVLPPPPAGATVLVLNDPGVDAEPFLYQACHAHAGGPGGVVYAVTNRAPARVLEAMHEFGFDLPEASRPAFLDAFSMLMGVREPAAYTLDRPADVEAFATLLERAATEHPDAVLVLDSLSSLIDNATPEAFTAAFPRILAAMRRFRLAISLFTEWPYPEAVAKALAPMDAVVRLRGVEERVMFKQYFSVERVAWAPPADTNPRLYKAIKPGGVFVYIPKIVVTGPYNAGKSTFVHAVSESAVSVDRLGTTVALDHGHVTIEGLVADVFGTPGQSRFDPILEVIAEHALGVIVVVDATKPESFARAQDLMQQAWRLNLPTVVAANKQDLPGALSPDEVRRRLGVPEGVAVVPCKGRDAASAVNVLKALVDRILSRGMAEAVGRAVA